METREGRSQQPFRYAPDLAWTRTQLGTFESPKIRHVWGEAFQNILLEGMAASPLIEAYQKRPWPIVLGINLYKRIPDIIQKALSNDETPQIGIGIDFSKFDSSIQPWLINEAFDILRQNITLNDIHEELAFEYSRQYFISRPVVMPDGRMWLTQLGIPSGSYYTQLVGSICNYIVITHAQQ